MSSPFSLFRQHQRVLMVVVTGFAMISFVLLGAVQDPRQMPTTLVILFLAAVIGGVAWLAGLRSGKASEYGMTGVLFGAILGIAVAIYAREAAAVQMDGGNLSTQEVSDLRRQRYIANQFVQMAFARSGERNQFEYYLMLPRFLFGFSQSDSVSTQDVVLGEVLRREADKMGLTISDKVVTDYIKEVTGDKMTSELFTEIRRQLQISEKDLIDTLRQELKARQAFSLIYGRNFATPETYWNFHEQLSVSATAELARIPVSSFVDEDSEPSDKELQELFLLYRNNVPGFTPEGQPSEGRPGFAQPRRIQLGFLEAVFDHIEPLVEQPTDAEIEAEYEERYIKSVPDSMDLPSELQLPPSLDLPLNLPDLPLPDKSKTDEKMETEEPPPGSVPGEPFPEPDLPLPGEVPEEGSDAAESKKAEPKQSEPKQSTVREIPADNPPADDNKTNEEESTEETTEESSSSNLPNANDLKFVFFQEDAQNEEPADATEVEPKAEQENAEQPKESDGLKAPEPADEKATEEKPESKKESEKAKPNSTPEKGDKSEDGNTPASEETPKEDAEMDIPPAPKSDVPPLDDELKAELREDLIRRRTQEEIRERTEAAYQFLSDISYKVQLQEGEENHLTREQATKKLEAYADEHHLEYVVTPMLSQAELQDSEDFAIGRAFTTLGQPQLVTQSVFGSAVTNLYTVGQADSFGTGSGFAYWKLADRPAYVAEDLDDGDYIRSQVTEVYKQLQAAPKAQDRAEALAKKARESKQPLTQSLSDETVTGEEDSLFLNIRETGSFSWMQRSSAPPTSMNQQQPVRRSVVSGADDAGDRFFDTVFNDLKEGDVGVAPNNDGSAFYVIRVKDRRPKEENELKKLKDDFIQAGMPPTFAQMAQTELRQHNINWMDRLFEEYNVMIAPDEAG